MNSGLVLLVVFIRGVLDALPRTCDAIIPDVHRLARYGSSDLAEYTVLTLL